MLAVNPTGGNTYNIKFFAGTTEPEESVGPNIRPPTSTATTPVSSSHLAPDGVKGVAGEHLRNACGRRELWPALSRAELHALGWSIESAVPAAGSRGRSLLFTALPPTAGWQLPLRHGNRHTHPPRPHTHS